MKVKFISLASGSSGNCYYLGTETYGILIDAGIGIRTIKKTLKDFNILMDSIRAVFITHAACVSNKVGSGQYLVNRIPARPKPKIEERKECKWLKPKYIPSSPLGACKEKYSR